MFRYLRNSDIDATLVAPVRRAPAVTCISYNNNDQHFRKYRNFTRTHKWLISTTLVMFIFATVYMAVSSANIIVLIRDRFLDLNSGGDLQPTLDMLNAVGSLNVSYKAIGYHRLLLLTMVRSTCCLIALLFGERGSYVEKMPVA